jgi:hypothetical protein
MKLQRKGISEDKINELETDNKKKENIRNLYKSLSEYEKDYQFRINFIKDENGDQLADCHSILNR